jgi:hypothetical protein
MLHRVNHAVKREVGTQGDQSAIFHQEAMLRPLKKMEFKL